MEKRLSERKLKKLSSKCEDSVFNVKSHGADEPVPMMGQGIVGANTTFADFKNVGVAEPRPR